MATRSELNLPLEPGPLIDSVIALARSSGEIEVLWLYGSRAKGNAQVDSDYDFAAAFADGSLPPHERRLRPELLAIDWAEALGDAGNRLSLVDINLAPLPLVMAIVTSGKVLYCGSGLRLAREENRITGMWELDYQYHQRLYG
jgi:predicted nucleotidyltransferase